MASRFIAIAWLGCLVLAVSTTVHGSGPNPAVPAVSRSILNWTWGYNMADVTGVTAENGNVVHVFPHLAGLGTYPGTFMPPAAARQGLALHWAQELSQLHAAGNKVYAWSVYAAFNKNSFATYGHDPELVAARNADGTHKDWQATGFGPEIWEGCMVNTNFTNLHKELVSVYADAGFDGMIYDVYAYFSGPLSCQCVHCQASWDKQMTDVGLSTNTPLPEFQYGDAMTDSVYRIFWKWRMNIWVKLWQEIADETKAVHPDFVFGFFNNTNPETQYYVAMTDIYDFVQYETYGESMAPYSYIPRYLMMLAAGREKDMPATLVSNDGVIRNAIQNKIYYAEGYACGGTPISSKAYWSWGTGYHGTDYFKFVEAHEDIYARDESYNNVAILYSHWSEIFYGRTSGADTGQFEQGLWHPYWMGQMLLDTHVPFDYIIAERDLADTSALLEQYKTLIIPNVACMTDETISALTAYLHAGGSIVATKDTGTYDLDRNTRPLPGLDEMTGQSITTTTQLTVGAGRFVYFDSSPEVTHWHNNPRDFRVSSTLNPPSPPPASVMEKLDWAFNGTVPLETDAAISTVIIPSKKEDRIFLHLVNYNVYPDATTLTPDTDIHISIDIPVGQGVTNVFAVSPDFAGSQALTEWAVDSSNVLHLTLNQLQYYSIVVVDMEGLRLNVTPSAGNSTTLDFEWANHGATSSVYDLESVESLTYSNWLPYHDGVTTYAEIPADASGTNILTGVLAPGTQAFFRVLGKVPPPPPPITYLAFDDFSTYTDGAVNGQAGSPFGFSGTWTATSAAISGGVLTQTSSAGVGASTTRSFFPYPIASSGTVYIRTTMALGTASILFQNSFFILSPDNTLSPNIICQGGDFLTGASQFRVMGDNGANIGTPVGVNDGGMHTWLIELNLDTGACAAWVDPDINAFDRSIGPMTASTAGTAFGQITVQTFGAGSRVELDEMKVGPTLESLGVTEL